MNQAQQELKLKQDIAQVINDAHVDIVVTRSALRDINEIVERAYLQELAQPQKEPVESAD